MTTLQFLLAALTAYLIGAFPTGVLATKLVGGPDVRYSGSGHTGGTNAMRLTNVWVGVAVVIVDGLKGLLAWGLVYIILLGNPWALPLAGAMAVIGHCWPIYTRFHGGMGLATGGGVDLCHNPYQPGLCHSCLGHLLFWHFQEGILTALCCPEHANRYSA